MRRRNIKEWIEGAHGWLVMVEKGIGEIGQMARLRKSNEDGVSSKKVEAMIGEGRRRWMTRSRNVGED
jgi:hypothetical protein